MNMNASPLSAELDAALAWWRLAGVDYDYAEDATDWLGAAVEAVEPPAARKPNATAEHTAEPVQAKTPRASLLGANPPSDLSDFRQFWLEAPGLDAIGPRGRVAARGPANPELMVLVCDPEERDDERLLSGPQGQLMSRMLAAMGFEEDAVYIASALPRHTPMADAAAIATQGMDEVVLHHISLVAPSRVVAFGSNIPPLLGHTLTKEPSSLREINQIRSDTPLLLSEGLDSLMAMPRLKARFWRRWMEWSAVR